jgi:hypothetical protein
MCKPKQKITFAIGVLLFVLETYCPAQDTTSVVCRALQNNLLDSLRSKIIQMGNEDQRLRKTLGSILGVEMKHPNAISQNSNVIKFLILADLFQNKI